MDTQSTSKANYLWIPLLVAALSLLLASNSFAQVSGGTLSGRVTDASGAFIPAANITIKNLDTGVSRTLVTDEAGLYSAPNLIPGTYEITVASTGFATEIRSGVTLTVGAEVVLNFTLQLGKVSQTVKVTGEAPAVQLANSSIGATVESNEVRELPLNGRDWTSLAVLQAGVASIAQLQPAISSGFERGNRGFGSQMNIAGARPQQDSYRLDGININDHTGGGPGSVSGASLGVDAIREFSVLTGNYSAEYGRTSGGIVNAISRSGTNQLHGSAYEFLRNSDLDAANFFDNQNNISLPPFRRNQFGASGGGPIRKDKTFIFGDYEGLRQTLGQTTQDFVPSLDARSGLWHNADGTTTQYTVDPLVKPYLALWPSPNGPIQASGNTAIFAFAGNQVTNENYYTARVDHILSEKNTLFGSWSFDEAKLNLPDSFDGVSIGSDSSRQFAALEETHTFSPMLINSVRVGFNRSQAINALGSQAINPLAKDPSLASVPGRFAPSISVGSGISLYPGGLLVPTYSTYAMNSFQAYDDLFYTKGIHSLKFGFAAERQQSNELQFSAPGGLWKFSDFPDFLTNYAKNFTAALPPQLGGALSPRGLRQSNFGGYAQDDIRWKPNLTVNVGVRYEMATVPTEVQGKLSSLASFTSPAPTLHGPLFKNPSLKDFQPRVGFAWDPSGHGKTSIRSGFGLFDVLPLLYEYQQKQFTSPPYFYQGLASWGGTVQDMFPTAGFDELKPAGLVRTAFINPNPKRNYVLQWNLDVEHQFTPSLSATVTYVGTHAVHQVFHMDEGNIVVPTLTSAGYMWPGGADYGQGTVINPHIGRMDTVDWPGSASYQALEVHITKRMAHNFQVGTSYTWGKTIDQGSASIISDPYSNSITSMWWFNPKLRRGLADYNVGQNLTLNYTWVVPTPASFQGPAGWIARGWQVGGIFTAQTGMPFTPFIGGDPMGVNSADPYAYPNRLNTPGCGSLVNPRNVNDYIKTQCFGLPLSSPAIAAQCVPFVGSGTTQNPEFPGTCANLLGNAGRNIITGPGLQNLDFSLFKNNHIKRFGETFNVQFRAEMFNVLNHANFASPTDNNTIFDQPGTPTSGAGTIDKTTNASREIQFAVKVIW